MHRWISTDNGSQCFVCGVVLDYWSPDYEFDQGDRNKSSEIAHNLVPGCNGPKTNRAHHFVLGGQWVFQNGPNNKWENTLECAYDNAKCTPHSWPANPECKGA